MHFFFAIHIQHKLFALRQIVVVLQIMSFCAVAYAESLKCGFKSVN